MAEKAQVLTLENVMFFSLGVVMVLLVYQSYLSISKDVEKETAKYGLKKIAAYISYEVNRIYRAGSSTNSNISSILVLPSSVSRRQYILMQDSNAIYLFLPAYGFRVNLTLYGINAKLKTRSIPSSKRFIEIAYSQGKVEIG